MNPFQMFNQTFMNMNLNMSNMNSSMNANKLSLLSLINSSILVQEHIHPLIYCLTIDRSNFYTNWTCNKCGINYTYNIPSFYCIFCDFDICEACILSHKLFDIIVFDYNLNLLNFTMNNPLQLFKWQSIFPFHNHLLTLIKKTNINFFWFCNVCNNKYGNDSAVYYCSLCNFHLCQNCVIQWKNNMNNSGSNFKVENPKYFSNNNDSKTQFNNSGSNFEKESPSVFSDSQKDNNSANNTGSNWKNENPKYFSGNQLK